MAAWWEWIFAAAIIGLVVVLRWAIVARSDWGRTIGVRAGRGIRHADLVVARELLAAIA